MGWPQVGRGTIVLQGIPARTATRPIESKMAVVGREGFPALEDAPPKWLTSTPNKSSRWGQIGRAAIGLPLRRRRMIAGTLAAVLMGLAWVAIVATGGRNVQFADITYGAVLISALFFGAPGGIASGTIVLLLVSPVGPLMPQDQTGWAVHGSLAIVIGGGVGARSYILDHALARANDLTERLATTYRKTLYLIAEAIELRDPITAGHSHRVATNARTLGQRIGLSEAELSTLYWAGLLHDVGKIAVPETILQKPGQLNAAEWELMRDHPRLGAGLIARTSQDLASLAEAVGSHHECWDGSGYPIGLVGESIPLMGRVLAIVDVFEALTSSRPYRAALSADDALVFILRNSGKRFDPSLIPIFENLFLTKAIVIAPCDEFPQLSLAIMRAP